MPLEEVQEILNKYKTEESKIEKILETRELQEKDLTANKSSVPSFDNFSFEEAVRRNRQVLKDLETAKGNLRSKAIFSPSEMQWETITRTYREIPSLPITTYRCHLPIFV